MDLDEQHSFGDRLEYGGALENVGEKDGDAQGNRAQHDVEVEVVLEFVIAPPEQSILRFFQHYFM